MVIFVDQCLSDLTWDLPRLAANAILHPFILNMTFLGQCSSSLLQVAENFKSLDILQKKLYPYHVFCVQKILTVIQS